MVPPDISLDALRCHVETLASKIGERNVFQHGSLEQAAAYIENIWREQGYEPRRLGYTLTGSHNVEVYNIEVTRIGTVQPDEILLVGAHYDSVVGSPGANDNASGVATLLEISRIAATAPPPARTLRFVAFVCEEPPFFKTARMGSRVYARAARARGDNIRLMLSLETIGWYSDRPRSQYYPPLFGWFYPDRGNFLAFVSDLSSRSEMHRAVAIFRAHSDFPVEAVATFALVPGVDWSDHGSFWRYGYRAFMVTDTAPYRYPYYHTAADTPDHVNYEALARVTQGLAAMLTVMANTAF